jgi:hypothetical protein
MEETTDLEHTRRSLNNTTNYSSPCNRSMRVQQGSPDDRRSGLESGIVLTAISCDFINDFTGGFTIVDWRDVQGPARVELRTRATRDAEARRFNRSSFPALCKICHLEL